MIQVRPERPAEIPGIRRVNEAAFCGPVEAALVDAVRARGKVILSLVAVEGNEVLGHILFTPVRIEGEGGPFDAAALGPMAVVPERQRQGIGSRLVEAGLRECSRLGWSTVFLVGHPSYYPRFGFRPAARLGLECEYPGVGDAFMVIELVPGSMAGRRGVVRYLPEFGSA